MILRVGGRKVKTGMGAGLSLVYQNRAHMYQVPVNLYETDTCRSLLHTVNSLALFVLNI